MNNQVYVVGIPTHPELVTPELTSFVNDGIPTLYVFDGNIKEEVNNYSWFKENSFKFLLLDEVINENLIQLHRVICHIGINIYDHGQGVIAMPKRIAQKLANQIDVIKEKYPNTRIAFITFGDPYVYDRHISRAIRLRPEWQVIRCQTHIDPIINKFYELAILCSTELKKGYKKNAPYDRSGLFFDNPNPTIPADTHTDKRIEQILDETALSYANQNPIIAWSGGIDSTAIVASFVKNNIDFRVTVGKSSQKENPELHDYFVANFNTITIPDDNNLSGIEDKTSLIITGEPADHLFPEISTNFDPNNVNFIDVISGGDDIDIDNYANIFLTPVDQQYLYNNVREYFVTRHANYYQCDKSKGEDLYDTYLLPIIEKFPFEVKHYYQFKFFFKFIFNYQATIDSHFIKGSKCKNPTRGFFDTPDFQRWALTNLDYNFENYAVNYKTDKLFLREYSHKIFSFNSVLNAVKYPSLLNPYQNHV